MMQFHDGLLDIIRGSDLVTVSYNHFKNHDKGLLIGNSDSRADDEGKLRVTMHHNWFEDVKERSPRVRYGPGASLQQPIAARIPVPTIPTATRSALASSRVSLPKTTCLRCRSGPT